LLPIIERLAEANAAEKSNRRKHNNFFAVVISPTRELANQIAVEFEKLATFHPHNLKSQSITMIGGTNIDKDKKRLQRDQNIRVVIATPGRLQDHLNQNTSNIVERISHTKILCLVRMKKYSYDVWAA
jgi:superfamily II DNA/RNA helicase